MCFSEQNHLALAAITILAAIAILVGIAIAILAAIAIMVAQCSADLSRLRSEIAASKSTLSQVICHHVEEHIDKVHTLLCRVLRCNCFRL